MTAIGWMVTVLALGINAHAIVALVLGSERRGTIYVEQLALRCGLSAAGFALVSVAFLIGVATTGEPAGRSAADRARWTAMVIAETLNNSAFMMAACLLPVIAALVLRGRARRAGKGGEE